MMDMSQERIRKMIPILSRELSLCAAGFMIEHLDKEEENTFVYDLIVSSYVSSLFSQLDFLSKYNNDIRKNVDDTKKKILEVFEDTSSIKKVSSFKA